MDRSLLPPHLFTHILPPEEHEYANHSTFLMGQLAGHLKEFRSAVRLFEHCWSEREKARFSGNWMYDPDRDHDSWMFIAARAAATEVYHYWIILRALRSTIGRCASIRDLLDDVALKQAVQLLEVWFDPIELRRHAISHASEMVESSQQFQFNFPTDTGDWIISALDPDGTFKLRHGGRKMVIAVNEASLMKLESVLRRVFAAIRPAADWTFANGLSRNTNSG